MSLAELLVGIVLLASVGIIGITQTNPIRTLPEAGIVPNTYQLLVLGQLTALWKSSEAQIEVEDSKLVLSIRDQPKWQLEGHFSGSDLKFLSNGHISRPGSVWIQEKNKESKVSIGTAFRPVSRP